MTARLVKAESGDLTGLWDDIFKFHEASIEMDAASQERRAARDAGTENARRFIRAQSLASKAEYGKAAKELTQHATLYQTS